MNGLQILQSVAGAYVHQGVTGQGSSGFRSARIYPACLPASPAWIGVGTFDLLREESVVYANSLREAGAVKLDEIAVELRL